MKKQAKDLQNGEIFTFSEDGPKYRVTGFGESWIGIKNILTGSFDTLRQDSEILVTVHEKDRNTYAAFYQGKEAEIMADTLWGAKVKAIAHFKVSKKNEGLVAVILVAIDGKVITHSTTSL